ncbi:MAG: hypothetical protein JW913_02825 [Chitinispirillaceae bacterium]|nr:hypothetical protein [Chitinispirillaceae bacterium]
MNRIFSGIAVPGIFLIGMFLCDKTPVTPEWESTCTWNGTDSIDYLFSVTCGRDFERLEGEPLSLVYGDVGSVKIVYDINSDSLYFTDSRKYELHYTFCRLWLGYGKTHADFNREQYSNGSERLYYLASLNYYRAPDLYTLEFVPGDKIPAQAIELVFHRLQDRFFHGDKLKYLPTSPALDSRTVSLNIPKVTSEQIYAGQNYQAVNRAQAYGYLTRVDVGEVETTYLSRHAVVLTNGVPNDISVVAGIITTDFQSPLSHINVLSRNRGTPNMALRSAWNDSTIGALEGKLVFLEVAADTFTLRETTLDEAENYWVSREQRDPVTIACNDTTAGLFPIARISHHDIPMVGAKAANFGELEKISVSNPGPIPLPEGAFAIPFYYYRRHMANHGLDSIVLSMLSDSAFITDAGIRDDRLKALRSSIIASPLDSGFLRDVQSLIVRLSSYTRIRFRSSTNAEDLEEFNGAGLYESFTGRLDDPDRSVEQAIKSVWASLWNFRAFEEREYFRIDHRRVAMGILAHRSFPDEEANGVAITRNIYNPAIWGLTIDVQQGEISVVTPPADVTSDQLLFHTLYENPFEDPVIEYLSRSNISGEKTVLSEAEVVKLAKYLMTIKTWFYTNVYNGWQKTSFPDFAMDVEFKFDSPDRKLYIKQARPYK